MVCMYMNTSQAGSAVSFVVLKHVCLHLALYLSLKIVISK